MKYFTLLHSREYRIRRIFALIICLSLILPVSNVVDADASVRVNAENISVETDTGRQGTVKTLLVTNAAERYVSLNDMAAILAGTDKAFSVSISGSDVTINRGSSASGGSGAYSEENTSETRRINTPAAKLTIDDVESGYSCFTDDLSGNTECFMRIADFVMMADVNMYYDGSWHINTAEGFRVSKEELVSGGYFDGIDAALVGDADTGEIFFEYKGDEKLEIASTTKLISYAVIMDAISNGEITYDDMVTISAETSRLSKSEDGVVEYEVGEMIPVRELIIAMLLPSSNESAYAMAEYVSGTEEAFVERMKDKLDEIGVYDAELYNSHGLPVYEDNAYSSKNQNRMSAEDMFRVVCHIFGNYPEITDITSMKNYKLEYAGDTVKNTNGLLKNMKEVTGLKTGTTTKAGACLVASCRGTNGDGDTHNLTAILFGAESNTARISYGELLIHLAMQEFEEGTYKDSSEGFITFNDTPDAKKLLAAVLKNARLKGLIE